MSERGRQLRGTAWPSKLTTIREILDNKHRNHALVNVMGLVVDHRVPVPTQRDDWKCTITIYDPSVAETGQEIDINVFRPKDEMPVVGSGDVVLLHAVKLNTFRGILALLTSFNTDILVYEAAKIPRPPKDGSLALRPAVKKIVQKPDQIESEFVSHLYHSIDKGRVPEPEHFEVLTVQSANVKTKFKELKDVQDGLFADIIAEVVREPYQLGDKVTLWVSDYTENNGFFHQAFKGLAMGDEARDGDPYGYGAKYSKSASTASSWTGPYGKRSMQVTCWEPHSSTIIDGKIGFGAWVSIKNLQIKYGGNVLNLEGKLREDQSYPNKIGISVLDPLEDPENINPLLKAAIRRKRDYEREKKSQLQSITDAAKAGLKRKANVSPPEDKAHNAKSKRKAKRAKAALQAKEIKEAEAEAIFIPNMNSNVKCEHQTKPGTTVAEILEPVFQETTINGETINLELPFSNINFRANARVVDFLPHNLADFARPKKQRSQYDMLSDNGESDTESESDSGGEQDMMTKFRTTDQEWEWCFYLRLEDASPSPAEKTEKETRKRKRKRDRIWVLVDNSSAQYLANLDASNLRMDSENLEILRQRMFILWGNLEERKSRSVAAAARVPVKEQAPAHSSDEEEKEDDGNNDGSKGDKVKNANDDKVTNLPFPCCIRQYGVKVPEDEPGKATAGDGMKWHRMFGLFGTKISAA